MNKNKSRIAVIGLKGLPAFGGAATVGQNIISKLNQEYDFTVFSVESHAKRDFKMENVEQIVFNRFSVDKLNILVYYIKSALFILFKGDYDLVHLHHTDGAFILPLLKLKYRVVLTSHAQPQESKKWSKLVNLFFSINEKIAIKMADKFTVVSKPLKQVYVEKYNKETLYIPNGVDLDLIDSVKNQDSYIEPYMMFSAGRIISSKGLHLLLTALQETQYKGKLIVAGNLDHVPYYKKQILRLAKGLNVEFLGLIKDKRELLNLVRNAQVFVYPTLYEAMSIMLMEAAMLKVPILCSDIPANVSVFTNNEVTFFESNNSGDLAHKIKDYFNESRDYHFKAQCAYDLLKKSYVWKGIAQEYSLVYKKML